MIKSIETVTGTIPISKMGKTLIHEHLLFGYPGFEGDVTLGPFIEDQAMDCAVKITTKAIENGVKAAGGPTPIGSGGNRRAWRKWKEVTATPKTRLQG